MSISVNLKVLVRELKIITDTHRNTHTTTTHTHRKERR